MNRKLTNASDSDNSRKTDEFHWILVYGLSNFESSYVEE